MLSEPRNWIWLGRSPSNHSTSETPSTATDELTALSAASVDLRSLVADESVDLDDEFGGAAGPFADATRRSFVLHVADELIHHSAESALLRDLYAGRAFQ